MLRRITRAYVSPIAAVLLLSASNTYAADLAEQAGKLLAEGKPTRALALLEPQIGDNRDPELDYLFGIAALDSGMPGLALFAFERVLAVQPEHIYARAELARALFRLGEFEDAIKELDNVKTLNPPQELVTRMNEYEAAMNAALGPKYRLSAFFEALGGYDTNYGSSTDQRQVGIPAFGGILFTLDELFVEDESPFFGARMGAALTAPVNRDTLFIAQARLEGAEYTDSNSDYYTVTVRGNIGMSHRVNQRSVISIGFNGFSTWARTLNYVKTLGTTATWDYALSPDGSITSFLRVGRQYYDDEIDFRDTKQYLAGTGYTHRFNRTKVGLHVFGGTEEEVDDSREDIGRELFGVRMNVSYIGSRNWYLFGSVMGQFSWYGGRDLLFLTKRQDDELRVSGGMEYRFSPLWSVRPELTYIDHYSTLPTSEFDRFIASVSIRRDFN